MDDELICKSAQEVRDAIDSKKQFAIAPTVYELKLFGMSIYSFIRFLDQILLKHEIHKWVKVWLIFSAQLVMKVQ